MQSRVRGEGVAMARRKYESGSRWAFWRWTHTPSNYITRLHLLKTPWFAVDIHWLNGPDPEPDMHDHPVTFLSVIVWGAYVENRKRRRDAYASLRTRAYFNFIRACKRDRHKIIHVLPKTITICFMGPKTREWGFHTPKGWVHWREYNKKYRG